MTPRLETSLLALGLLLSPLRPSGAQANALRSHAGAIFARATVVTDRGGAASMRPMVFEASRQDRPTTVGPTEPEAGEWRLVGRPNTQIQINLTLPTELVNHRLPHAPRLPVRFSRGAGRWRQEVDDPTGAVPFDPHAGAVGRFATGRTFSTLYIWLGTSVEPTGSTVAGTYGGTVLMTILYY